MIVAELEVVGLPAPKGSKTGFYNQTLKRVVIVEGKSGPGRKAVAAWQDAVCEQARLFIEAHPQPPLTGPLAVDLKFRFPPTKSDPYRFWHATKPDLDKLVRATFDAMKLGGLIADDASICKLVTLKRYLNASETAGCSIRVDSLASEEAEVRESRKQRAANARKALPNPLQEQLLA